MRKEVAENFESQFRTEVLPHLPYISAHIISEKLFDEEHLKCVQVLSNMSLSCRALGNKQQLGNWCCDFCFTVFTPYITRRTQTCGYLPYNREPRFGGGSDL